MRFKNNCQKFSSETKFDSCSDGFKLKENGGISFCYKEEIYNSEDDDDGLSKSIIAGFVLGSVGFAGIISLMLLLILKKKKAWKRKKERELIKKIVEIDKEKAKAPLEDDIKFIEFDKRSEIMDVTDKRMAPKDKTIY